MNLLRLLILFLSVIIMGFEQDPKYAKQQKEQKMLDTLQMKLDTMDEKKGVQTNTAEIQPVGQG